ncbi:MAG: GNAT family N-acetyltransferase [Pyrinomonadaceae bacterium]|nr:GNAT family N-acetyltransferase [Pyrinomonadaceae bacterium]
MLIITQAETDEQIAEAKALFREYESWFGMDLCFQGFEAELAALPGKYAMPDGRLYLAYVDDTLAGCIALRKLYDDICEMKRLFVRDGFRGAKVGVSLIERVIAEAQEIGYSKMRLDTYPPKMGKAVSLYLSHGFVQIPPYYNNPHPDVLYLELAL